MQFNHILQGCSMSAAQYFAASGRKSAEAMQTMTERMECMTEHMHHKTVSMHVITIFTLIFLPGTFVAVSTRREGQIMTGNTQADDEQTVFSSGILTFGNEGEVGFGSNLGDWKIRVAGLKLFFSICLPLLFITIGAWFLVYWLSRRKTGCAEEGQDLAEKGGNDGEKK